MIYKFFAAALISIHACPLVFAEKTYDLVIYGPTSAGIAAAVQVKKMGGSVIVIEPTKRIGGLTTGGLGAFFNPPYPACGSEVEWSQAETGKPKPCIPDC